MNFSGVAVFFFAVVMGAASCSSAAQDAPAPLPTIVSSSSQPMTTSAKFPRCEVTVRVTKSEVNDDWRQVLVSLEGYTGTIGADGTYFDGPVRHVFTPEEVKTGHYGFKSGAVFARPNGETRKCSYYIEGKFE